DRAGDDRRRGHRGRLLGAARRSRRLRGQLLLPRRPTRHRPDPDADVRRAHRRRPRLRRRPVRGRARLSRLPYGWVEAGGSFIWVWSALYGVSGTVIRPRVGRSRSKVTSSSIVTRTVAKIIGHTPRPSTDR